MEKEKTKLKNMMWKQAKDDLTTETAEEETEGAKETIRNETEVPAEETEGRDMTIGGALKESEIYMETQTTEDETGMTSGN